MTTNNNNPENTAMNLSQFALTVFVTVVVLGAIAVIASQSKATTDDALRCTAAGGKPMRTDGTTHCLNAQLFVPN